MQSSSTLVKEMDLSFNFDNSTDESFEMPVKLETFVVSSAANFHRSSNQSSRLSNQLEALVEAEFSRSSFVSIFPSTSFQTPENAKRSLK